MLRRLHFDLWYLFRPPWDTRVSPPELLQFIQNHPPGRAIDLGCGTGTNVLTLARHGWDACGIDFSARAIAIAGRRIEAAKLEASVKIGDVTRLESVPEPYDLALDIGCFHSVDRRRDYLRGLRQVLRTGGHWLMYAFVRAEAGGGGPGLDHTDFDLIKSEHMTLLSRTDGKDRGAQSSAWFLYRAAAEDQSE